jgi:hypothetical protein
MVAFQCSNFETWKRAEATKFAYCTCIVGWEDDIENALLLFAVSWPEKRQVSCYTLSPLPNYLLTTIPRQIYIVPFTIDGARYFAVVGRAKQVDDKHIYPLLCKNGRYQNKFCLFNRTHLNDADSSSSMDEGESALSYHMNVDQELSDVAPDAASDTLSRTLSEALSEVSDDATIAARESVGGYGDVGVSDAVDTEMDSVSALQTTRKSTHSE